MPAISSSRFVCGKLAVTAKGWHLVQPLIAGVQVVPVESRGLRISERLSLAHPIGCAREEGRVSLQARRGRAENHESGSTRWYTAEKAFRRSDGGRRRTRIPQRCRQDGAPALPDMLPAISGDSPHLPGDYSGAPSSGVAAVPGGALARVGVAQPLKSSDTALAALILGCLAPSAALGKCVAELEPAPRERSLSMDQMPAIRGERRASSRPPATHHRRIDCWGGEYRHLKPVHEAPLL